MATSSDPVKENKPKPGDFARVDIAVAPFRDRLTPRDVGRGVLAANRNARRLFRDAVALFEQGRHASAVSLAILAQEEAAKPLALAVIATEPRPSPLAALAWPMQRLRKALWRDFEDHTRKTAATLRMHVLTGNFSSEVRERLENRRQDESEGYVRIRERCTYVDCVQGVERWSTPDTVLGPDGGLILLRVIRKTIGRIATAALVAKAHAASEWAARMCDPERLKALGAWGATTEAQELSRLDLEEARAWSAEVDATLARLTPEAEQETETGRTAGDGDR